MGQYAPTYMTNLDGYDEDTDVLKAPVNRVLPYIVGIARVGQVLSVNTGVWTARPAAAFTYQWKRGGVNIAGATNQTYVPVSPADDAVDLTCAVTGTNSQGNSMATTASLNIPDSTP